MKWFDRVRTLDEGAVIVVDGGEVVIDMGCDGVWRSRKGWHTLVPWLQHIAAHAVEADRRWYLRRRSRQRFR